MACRVILVLAAAVAVVAADHAGQHDFNRRPHHQNFGSVQNYAHTSAVGGFRHPQSAATFTPSNFNQYRQPAVVRHPLRHVQQQQQQQQPPTFPSQRPSIYQRAPTHFAHVGSQSHVPTSIVRYYFPVRIQTPQIVTGHHFVGDYNFVKPAKTQLRQSLVPNRSARDAVQTYAPYVGPPTVNARGRKVQTPAGFMFSFNLVDPSSHHQQLPRNVPGSHGQPSYTTYTLPRANAGILPIHGEGRLTEWQTTTTDFPPYRK